MIMHRRPGRALGTSVRIGLLTLGLAIATAGLYFLHLVDQPASIHGFHIAWWVLAPMDYVAAISLVHLHFRRDAHSFSLSEVALVLGLLFASPREIMLAQLIGSTVALAIHRRLSSQKVMFNLTLDALAATLAITVFHALVRTGAVYGPKVWLAALAACMTAAVVAGIMVVAAISISEGRLQPDRLRTVLIMSAVAAVTNTSMGLIAGSLLLHSPQATFLLAIPIGTVFLSYGAYLREREKHESLEFLYTSTRILSEMPELEQAVLALVAQAREMFRAETAQMLFVTGEADELRRTRVSDADATEVMTTVDEDSVRELWYRVSRNPETLLLEHPTGIAAYDEFLESQGLTDAMVTSLRGESRAFGLAVVGNRVGGVSFDSEDARLFETLASHTSVAARGCQRLVRVSGFGGTATVLDWHRPGLLRSNGKNDETLPS